MATSTATFIFVRQLGGTIGVSIGQAIWSSVRIYVYLIVSTLANSNVPQTLRRKAAAIKGVTIDTSPGALAQSVRSLRTLYPDATQRQEVIHAYTLGVTTIWLSLLPMVGFSFLLVLFLRKYTLKRTIVRGGKGSENAGDEKSPEELGNAEAGEKSKDNTNNDIEKRGAGEMADNSDGNDMGTTDEDKGARVDTSATNTMIDSHNPVQRV